MSHYDIRELFDLVRYRKSFPASITRTTDESILRPNYLVTLVPYNEVHKKPRYRGDVYDGRPTKEANDWEIET